MEVVQLSWNWKFIYQIDPVDSKNSFRIIVSLQTKKFYKWCLLTYSFQNLFSQTSLNKLLCFDSYIDFKAIFGIYRVNLHNRILISTWLGDLYFSASSTMRPKLQRPCDWPLMTLEGWKFVVILLIGPHNWILVGSKISQSCIIAGPRYFIPFVYSANTSLLHKHHT